MNISTFRAMLERRGYDDFFFRVKKDGIECTVCGPHVEKAISFDQQEWNAMTVKEARIYLDEMIGEGMMTYLVGHLPPAVQSRFIFGEQMKCCRLARVFHASASSSISDNSSAAPTAE
jgi:hypothetical protein